ncbi:MAG: LapA family protein [Candidatus Hydrogenedentota bacterium]|nr:MAG: LapA family protein [Candidatus Hydrogenedentota bacterium]
MSGRLSLLGISFILYLILLLSNTEAAPVRFFLLQLQVPVFYVIALSTLFGIFVTLLFSSMYRRERKLKKKLREIKQKASKTA